MAILIRIFAGSTTIEGEFFHTLCGRAIVEALPIETRPHEWGDEFYFEVPVSMDLDESATTGVKVGDIGYWSPGAALAIFFGPTPFSRGSDPVPASAVNLVGRITGEARDLKKEKGTQKIRIEKA